MIPSAATATTSAAPDPDAEDAARAAAAHNLAARPESGESALPSATPPRKVRAIRAGGPDRGEGPAAETTGAAELARIEAALAAQRESLAALSREARGIQASVQLTEAYMTIGLTERMSAVLGKEVAAAERWCAAHGRAQRRAGRAVLGCVALGGLLLVEMETGALGPLYESGRAIVTGALATGLEQIWAWGETAVRAATAFVAGLA